MKAEEFRELSDEELGRKIVDLQEDQFRARFAAGRGAEANPAQKGEIRKNVARAKTIQRQRQLEGKKA